MSNEEILTVKEDIREIRDDVKGLVNAMSDLKLSIAENYIKKTDCKDCRENQRREGQKSKLSFWDVETKKTAFKWGGVIILVVIILLAGRGLAELYNIIPK